MEFNKEIKITKTKDMLKIVEKLIEISEIFCSWDMFKESDKTCEIRIALINDYKLNEKNTIK